MGYDVSSEAEKLSEEEWDDELINATKRKILLASFNFAVLVVLGVAMLTYEPRSTWLQGLGGIWTLIRYVGAAATFGLAAMSLLHHVYMCLPALHRAEADHSDMKG